MPIIKMSVRLQLGECRRRVFAALGFNPRDFRVGVFYNEKKERIYIHPLPTIQIVVLYRVFLRRGTKTLWNVWRTK